MKVTFLGTAAAEGWPGMYCNCTNCKLARMEGGKNIRTRTQTLVNHDLLLDYPADTYLHVIQNNLDLSSVRYCLITHSHLDHYAPGEFVYHVEGLYAHGMTKKELHVYGNERVSEIWKIFRQIYPEENPNMNITFHIVKAYETFRMGRYEVTPLPAVHAFSEKAFVYLIRDESRTLLYLLDTAMPEEEVIQWLGENTVKADMIVYDCTMGIAPNCPTHMNMADNIALHKRFLELGMASKETLAISDHFSHNGQLIHDKIEPLMKKEGFLTAWDGMTVEL